MLRDLCWLVLVSALGLGWWVSGLRLQQQRERLQAEMARIYEDCLPGLLLEEVIEQHHLEQTPNWHVVNGPPGEPVEVIYFLNAGDLHLKVTGEPAAVESAQFLWSEKSPAKRYEAMTAGWSAWVQAHSR